ncbi:MAG: hypothetical protein K8U57_24315 [Planctomycetes bacterium]|nr:hypothetical protein [Planctomycetota bacterium]
MTRYLCWVAVLGTLTLPDWASACWPRRAAYHSYYAEPVYYPQCYSYPVYPAYPLCVPPPDCCPPVAIQPMAPPRVEAVPKAAPSTGMGTATPRDVPPSGVRPASGTDTVTVSPMVPAAPTPKKTDPVTITPAPKHTDPPMTAPDPLPKFPAVVIPKDFGELPKLDVPKEPDFRPIAVPKDLPKSAIPKAAPAAEVRPEAGVGGMAVPSPAPPIPEGLIPSPSVPVLPDATKAPFPPLTLPPDTPVPPKGSVSRSSPLTATGKGEMTVSVFPAQAGQGEFLGNGYRTVGFYNHTERDMNLTIEGRVVKLPAKMYLHAKLAPTFTWSHGENPVVRESVPTGASGVDVVFRD